MKLHRQIILDNLTAEKYAQLSVDFLYKITNESERGAVLIGGSKVDEYLELLVVKILPKKNKNYQNRLLKYPGALSSFSGKIELLFAFRIIDEYLYNSLNTLRKIRNEAAHSSNEFFMQNIKEQLDSIYEFEAGFKTIANELAYRSLVDFKKENVKKVIEKHNLANEYDYEEEFNKRRNNPENDKIFQEQLTIWKFSYGLVFLCLKIEAVTIDYKEENNCP